MNLYWRYYDMEHDTWSIESGPTINPEPPADFQIQNAGEEFQIYIRGEAGKYGGALAKGVHPLPMESKDIVFSLNILIDDAALEYGQVLEFDTRITDSEGWTYPGDFQILLASGQPQIGDPWFNWGEPIVLHTNSWMHFQVLYELDYGTHTIRINESKPLAAFKGGWKPNEIVTQLQLCSNSKEGFHTVRYMNISVGKPRGGVRKEGESL